MTDTFCQSHYCAAHSSARLSVRMFRIVAGSECVSPTSESKQAPKPTTTNNSD